MGRTAGRNSEDTRKSLLAAAARVLRAKSTSATLDDIAREAGVSKGGLMYHFATKDELFLALSQALIDEFHACVDAETDPEDTAPGAYTRAYIRAMLTPHTDDAALEDVMLLGQLLTVPAVAVIARADADALEARLRNDGLHDQVRLLVVAAADGANIAPTWGGRFRPTAELDVLRQHLLDLTRRPHPQHR
ncbi:TetR family transcriptional regulator [Mycolicibacterium insubricum]|uniref:Uncharacterized protein n=1 Tax=Mycolicibacterium insubricum TaxID=444597 RepID=A0A1X0D3C2_9MYCO|nr:TetR family transcriptional regulator [Mycolicibacterium insubricum]MCV7080664.1 TetR/AcrR family transcriptional regulator [Mycolicibacterium insubricum]ORA66873.1 hypothetical protein BST26_16545 [Mycolicibacterium insubricum]BBZ64986.1 TetR family transcriptional regulator [Mycolicibacterium insubricum]